MYDDIDLDYSFDNSFNLDEDYAYVADLDEEYARKQTSFQELAYMHYA